MLRELARSFVLQYRVVLALVMREIHTRYGRENIGFLWVIGEPILFCAGVTVLWSLIRPSHEHGLPLAAFVITGYVPLTMWRHCISRSVKAFESNGSLLFHRQVSPLDIITARVVLEILGSLMAGAIVTAGAVLTGYMEWPVDLPLMYAGLFYQMVFCYASALLISALSEYSDVVEKSVSVVMYLSIPFSGAFTMVDWVPQRFQSVLLWSPSVQNLEMLRGGQFGAAVHAHYNLGYTIWSNFLLLLIGISLTLRIRPRLLIQ